MAPGQPPAHAWSIAGHMVHGALTYSILLQERPTTLARAVDILKAHPEYQGKWAKQLNADYVLQEDRDRMLFMLAARWPDDIRRDSNPYLGYGGTAPTTVWGPSWRWG